MATPAWAKQAIKKYPRGPRAFGGDPVADARAGAGRLGHQIGIEHVADMIGMPYIRALEVATFYTQFQLAPVGTRAHVQVCGTTPCMLRGSEETHRTLQDEDPPRAVSYQRFWHTVVGRRSNCQGACVNAPMVMIFKDAYEDLTPERLEEIIDAFERRQRRYSEARPADRAHLIPRRPAD